MNVTLEDAYAESCLALGEAIVRERLLTAEIERLTEQVQPKRTPPVDMPAFD